MKKIIVLIILIIASVYYFYFVDSKRIENSIKIDLCKFNEKRISVRHTDSYRFFTKITIGYSANKDTIVLNCWESTLANIFYKHKNGFKDLDIDSRVQVVNYCGQSIRIEQLHTCN